MYQESRIKNQESRTESRTGFTLIESLVAVSVLLVAIVGPLTIASQSLRTARAAEDKLVATFLAQEGVELVRVMRDNNTLSDVDWLNGLDVCSAPGFCYIDADTLSVSGCGIGDCPLVGFDEAVGYYGYSGGVEDTKFRRDIQIDQIDAEEITVTSVVAWESVSGTQTVTIEDNLLDWQ